jgi:hypothetical protein
VSSLDARLPSLLLPGVGHLHHLFFIGPLVGAAHFKHQGIVIHDFGHGTILYGTLNGVVVAAFLRNGLTIRAGSPFKEIDAGAHGINPGRYILLGMVVVPDDADAGERTPHHFTSKLLLQVSSVKVGLIFF